MLNGLHSISDLWYNETKKFSKNHHIFIVICKQSKIKTLQNIFENLNYLDITYPYKGSIIL
jgi:hypothetical protein